MNEQDRKLITDAKKAMLDVAIRHSSADDIMVLFAMAAASQNLELMKDIVSHPELKVDEQDKLAMTAAVKVCAGLVTLNEMIAENPNMDITEIEGRIEELTTGVLAELNMEESANDDFEQQAKVATDNLLSKFQLH